MNNVFGDSSNLHNSDDVEALFIEPLLKVLRYPANRIRRQAAIEELTLPTSGSHGDRYKPDYVLMDSRGRPVVVLDAKHPINENPSDFRYQVTGYALLINQRHEDNPVRYCVVTNGWITELLEWDRDSPILVVRYQDFDSGNHLYTSLRSALSYDVFNQIEAVKNVRDGYHRPTIGATILAFERAHDEIRKREKIGPTKAFYELAKLMFVKLRQDQNIQAIIEGGSRPTTDNFYFTTDWIEKQPTNNPVRDQLFQQVQQDLEADILAGRKKRIFALGELIDLRASTVYEVVRILENFDLHGIDEDLNGRMFETFLNATVRGKELGQYFTPRPVVKYMTKAARLRVADERLPRVIDACCGSGGFLIESLAELTNSINNSGQLTNTRKAELRKELETDTLYGIEANDEIGRVARLNMYLHGDGGSRIYVADSLDKTLAGEPGMPLDRASHLSELRGRLDDIRFDVALTNPPFSMTYSKKKEDEREILMQYQIGTGASRNSNVLFLERYYDLLNEDGELLTVIDDTVLNGVNTGYAREFIKEHFIIRQVVSLPFNTFFRAQATIKTSILHLRRKRPGEEQGDIFMAIANNVGHDDYKRDTPHRDNLPEIASLFNQWVEDGTPPKLFRENDTTELLGCPTQVFVVGADALQGRLDAFSYAPELNSLRERLAEREDAGAISLKRGRDFNLAQGLDADDKQRLQGQPCSYIEISDITRDGLVVSQTDALYEELPTRAKWEVKPWDVLFAKKITSRGTAVVIPESMDGFLVTSGFMSVRPRDEEESLILWTVFRSEIWRKQIYYLSITASQPEIRDHIFQDEMLIPWPVTEEQRTRIVNSARELLDAQQSERLAAGRNRTTLDDLLMFEE